MSSTAVIHPTYLPYSREELRPHFLRDGHLNALEKSARRHDAFMEHQKNHRQGRAVTHTMRMARQIEKDEQCWIVCALKAAFDAGRFAELLCATFSGRLPFSGFSDWMQCVGEKADQTLVFEASISSPLSYREAVRERFATQGPMAHPVRYVRDASHGGTRFEGATRVDALFTNRKTGVSVIFEAKVLSDTSCDVLFDPCRNQLVRNIDIMLDDGSDSLTPDPSKRAVAILTLRMFKDRPSTRHYGFLFHEYRRGLSLLAEHLPHRSPESLALVPERLGWLTFEDCARISPGCCVWLSQQDDSR